MTQPSAMRASAPAPVASTSGRPPSTVQIIVIITGRRRISAACSIASRTPMPAVAQLVGEFDDQDAVLGHDADQQHQADLAVGVEAGAGEQQREDRAGEAERHGRHDDDGADEALELRGQHQEDDDDREAEDRSACRCWSRRASRLRRAA